MTTRAAAIHARTAEIRRAFDDSFASAASAERAEHALLLGVRAGSGRFAIRLEEIAGVHRCGRIAKLPSGPEEILGIASVQGCLYAVVHLAALLGSAGAEASARWLLLAKGREPIALAVDGVDAQLRVDAADLLPLEGARQGGHVAWVLRQGEGRLGVLSVPSLLAGVEQRAPARRRGRKI